MFGEKITLSMPECAWDAVYMAVVDELEAIDIITQEGVCVHKRLLYVKRELEKLLESVQ